MEKLIRLDYIDNNLGMGTYISFSPVSNLFPFKYCIIHRVSVSAFDQQFYRMTVNGILCMANYNGLWKR